MTLQSAMVLSWSVIIINSERPSRTLRYHQSLLVLRHKVGIVDKNATYSNYMNPEMKR